MLKIALWPVSTSPLSALGTFVTRSLTDASLAAHEPLRRELDRWLTKARRAGLDEESIEALFSNSFREARQDIA